MDPLSSIFHERQEGSLCAQHCLNALLQGQYFSPVELADIARQLDDCERERMAECGTQTAEYQNFIEQPSSNFDDSGFFSIQVISNALRVWNLEVVQYNSQDAVAVAARENPVIQRAFICNFREHWFTVRKVGDQWFNLNSLLTGPELISDTYLSLFLTQLQQEGYSIFVLIGELPESDGDRVLRVTRAEQPIKPRLISDKLPDVDVTSHDISESVSDAELQRALDESRQLTEADDQVLQKTLNLSRRNDEEALLQRALQLSMLEFPSTSHASSQRLPTCHSEPVSQSESHIANPGQNSCSIEMTENRSPPTVSTDDDMLREAIRLSMEQP